MSDLDSATPVDGTDDQEVVENMPTEGANPENTSGPPPSVAERKAAREAREAAEKESGERPAEDAEAAEAEEPEAPKEPEEPEEPEGPEEPELDTSVWGDAGDDIANSVLQTLQNSGVTTEEAKALLWDAVQNGDPARIDRDALVEKVGKAKATLIMAGVENVISRNNQKIAEVSRIAHESAGGPENWAKAAQWAVSALPEKELNELRDLLDKGGQPARFAAGEIVARFNADPKNTALTAGTAQVKPDGKAPPAVKPITRREYGIALDRLHRKGGTPAEFKALRAQRDAGKKQGI